jgi:hypothetical protein
MFLVLSCIVPTCCAYRRRRRVEARLAQQQFDLHRLQQHSNFFIIDQLLPSVRNNSERFRRRRTEKRSEQLKEMTLVSTTLQIDIYTGGRRSCYSLNTYKSNTALSSRSSYQTLSESSFEKAATPVDLEKAHPAEEAKAAEDLDNDLYGEDSTS